MKFIKNLILSRIFTALLVLGYLTGGIAWAHISGSAHDFSGAGWSGGQICLPCHSPHNADPGVTGAPLWNHAITEATFTLYGSPTFDGASSITQPRGVSKLCLSCHDGTIGIDGYGKRNGTMFMTGPARLGTTLADDHPVSFKWNHNDIGGGTISCGQCHNLHGRPTLVSALPFFDGNVECATCHDVHAGTSYPELLRLPKDGSLICRYCHAK